VYIVVSTLRVKQAEGGSEWDAEKGIRPKREEVKEALVNFITRSFMVVSTHEILFG